MNVIKKQWLTKLERLTFLKLKKLTLWKNWLQVAIICQTKSNNTDCSAEKWAYTVTTGREMRTQEPIHKVHQQVEIIIERMTPKHILNEMRKLFDWRYRSDWYK